MGDKVRMRRLFHFYILMTGVMILSACGQISTESNRSSFQSETSTQPDTPEIIQKADVGRCVVEEGRWRNFRWRTQQTYCVDFQAEVISSNDDVEMVVDNLESYCQDDLQGEFQIGDTCVATEPVADLIDSDDTERILENTCSDERSFGDIILIVDHFTTDGRYELEKDALCERKRD